MIYKLIKVLFLVTLLFSIKTSVSNAQVIGTFDCMYKAPNCVYDPASVTCGEPFYVFDTFHCSKYSFDPSGCDDQKGVSCIKADCADHLGGKCIPVDNTCSGETVGKNGDLGCNIFSICCLPNVAEADCVDDLGGECVFGTCFGKQVGDTGEHGCGFFDVCCIPPSAEDSCAFDLNGECVFFDSCDDPLGKQGENGCAPMDICCAKIISTPDECGITAGDICISEEQCQDGDGHNIGPVNCVSDTICCDFPEGTDAACEKACNNKEYPEAICGSWNEQSGCRRPPDPNEELDCDIKGKPYDCYCCKDVPDMMKRPPRNPRCNPATGKPDIYGSGINSAIGCIPFSDFGDLVSFFLRWGISVGGGVAFLLILYSGFLITTSSGDPQKLQGGKELLTAAIAGLVMIIFSVFILELIGVRILQIPGFG